MQLVQRYAVQLQALEAAVERAPEMLGAAVGIPGRRTRPKQVAFRRDDDVLGIRVQRLGDQLLVHMWTVAVRGVEEVHAQFALGLAAKAKPDGYTLLMSLSSPTVIPEAGCSSGAI